VLVPTRIFGPKMPAGKAKYALDQQIPAKNADDPGKTRPRPAKTGQKCRPALENVGKSCLLPPKWRQKRDYFAVKMLFGSIISSRSIVNALRSLLKTAR